MKLTKKIIALTSIALLAGLVFAVDYTKWKFKGADGTTVEIELPSDLDGIINDNYSDIQNAITDNGVNATDISTAATEVKNHYDTLTDSGFTYSSLSTGLNDFCDALADSIPNSQSLQNVWAESWIGHIFPGLHFGVGLNAGVSSLDVTALKDAAVSMGLDGTSDIPETLVFPTLAGDLRVGGFILPFDVGFSFMSLSPFESLIDSALGDAPVNFSYFSIGGDIRYCLFKTGFGPLNVKISGMGGIYYTSGDLNLEDDSSKSSASMDFSATTFYLGAQASAKLLVLVPYLGARVMFTSSEINWEVTPDWNELLGSSATGATETALLALMPKKFGGGSENGFFDHIRPQVYGGIGFDLFVLNITAVGSYDFVSNVFGAGLNLRLAW